MRPTAWSPVSTEPVFWFYVKEVLSKHELQRFHALRHIASDVGRGRAWLRCALNENSLERYLHMLLADRGRLRYPGRVGEWQARCSGTCRRSWSRSGALLCTGVERSFLSRVAGRVL